jgi:type II secretory pathway component PulF
VMAMIGNVLMMGLFVLPRIAGVFLKLDLPLPTYTKIVLGLGQFMGDHRREVIIATVILFLLSAFVVLYQKTRAVLVQFVAKMPVIKKVVLHIDIARFSRTLSTLLKNGVPIINALDVSADVLTNKTLKNEAKNFSRGVARGESLSDVLVKNRKAFPTIMVQTIKAGEQSGNLEQVLEEMATFYESEVEYSLKRLTSLLEPLLMLIIGVVVGIMVIMMIAPIYSIIGGLQQTIQT